MFVDVRYVLLLSDIYNIFISRAGGLSFRFLLYFFTFGFCLFYFFLVIGLIDVRFFRVFVEIVLDVRFEDIIFFCDFDFVFVFISYWFRFVSEFFSFLV